MITDMRLMMGNKRNKRFQHSKKVSDQAHEKYSNITQIGHSLGSALATESARNYNDETGNVNGAITPGNLLDKQTEKEWNICTSLDSVSALQIIKPFRIDNNNFTIKNNDLHLLNQPSTNNLNKMDSDQIIGK